MAIETGLTEVFLSGAVGALVGAWIGGKTAGREQRRTEVYKMKRKALEDLDGKVMHFYFQFLDGLEYDCFNPSKKRELPNKKTILHLKQLRNVAKQQHNLCYYRGYLDHAETFMIDVFDVADRIFQVIENEQIPSYKELSRAEDVFDEATKAIESVIRELEGEFNPTITSLWKRQKYKISMWKIRRNIKRKEKKQQEQIT
ncbi:hypothetical protein GXN76_08250 [Kroppenstedtia pulmonis]|uniref:Uncharacterized protein n=1 Tax=Kroppenstedtia pulmonis TaxID=1380685 RepID=A0A7D4B2K0_9BACL|nr:hypothetical protein [Kroppenstedtia pulmonis]QKG84466.1 hypothetical protein GXN76_08250 [Kroppenstedtia pulmonis]